MADCTVETQPADIVFLLDSSASVGPENFEKLKQFVKGFANGFTIGPDDVRIGVVTFNRHVTNQFWMNEHSDISSLSTAIDNIADSGNATVTADGLEYVREYAFTEDHGNRTDVPDILIVMTDGRSRDKTETLTQAALLHEKNIRVSSVGVGRNLDQEELEGIASSPQDVYVVDNFDILASILDSLKKITCESPVPVNPTTVPPVVVQATAPPAVEVKVDGKWAEWGPFSSCSKSCDEGTQQRTRTCTKPAPANGGADCCGHSEEVRSCNPDPCPEAIQEAVLTTVSPLPEECPNEVIPTDLVFLLDSSQSVGKKNLSVVKEFIKQVVQSFEISKRGVNVAVVTFSDKARVKIWLNEHTTRKSLLEAVDKISTNVQKGTNTGDGLERVREKVFTEPKGDRDYARNMLIVMTDGYSGSPNKTMKETVELHKTDIDVMVIGVGGNIDMAELQAIASNPNKVFNVDGFAALKTLTRRLQKNVCETQ